MSDKEFNFTIREIEEFAQSRLWRSIVAYAIEQVNNKMEENIAIDPFKDPTTICRNQGFVAGANCIVDYLSVIKQLVEFERKEENKK